MRAGLRLLMSVRQSCQFIIPVIVAGKQFAMKESKNMKTRQKPLTLPDAATQKRLTNLFLKFKELAEDFTVQLNIFGQTVNVYVRIEWYDDMYIDDVILAKGAKNLSLVESRWFKNYLFEFISDYQEDISELQKAMDNRKKLLKQAENNLDKELVKLGLNQEFTIDLAWNSLDTNNIINNVVDQIKKEQKNQMAKEERELRLAEAAAIQGLRKNSDSEIRRKLYEKLKREFEK